ncbi:MAG: hypothetical protein ACLFPO_00900 [Spirochaetaceae bacterium]
MRRALLLLILTSVAAWQGSALELTEGRMRLVLHERSGRFSLEYRPDLRQERYIALIDNIDPRTSEIRIRDGNDVYRLGSSPRFDLSVERRTGGGASFVWESAELKITQQFSFVTSTSARLANGVVVELVIENVSEVPREVEARYLFDTHLAETRQAHFLLADGARIRSETEVRPSADRAWWATPHPEREGVGFQQLIAGEGITRPERVVFANWKRLSESAYDYGVNSERTFSLLPYSIDDSAAAVYYGAEELAPGASRRITTLVGNFDADGYADYSPARTQSAELLDRARDETAPELDAGTAREELISVNDLLEEIETLLSEDGELDAEDVEVVEEILRQLEARKEAYDTR